MPRTLNQIKSGWLPRILRGPGLLAPLYALWAGLAAAQPPMLTGTPLFISGSNGFAYYRIPAIVCNTNGTLLAFCEARQSTADNGSVCIAERRSTDGGKSWGLMTIAQEEGGDTNGVTIGNPAPVVDETTGHIFLIFCRNNSQVFYTVSADDGVTWSSRVEITSTCKLSNWGWYATTPGHGIQLRRGNQAGRLIVPADHQLTNGTYGDQVIYSDDHGATWHLGASADASGGVNPNENQAVELVSPAPGGGSQIYFNSRNNNGSAPGNRAQAWSTNGGSSYVGAFTNNTVFVCPVCQGSVLRFSATDEGATTNRIIFCCPNDSGSRVNISIWSSTNEGLSWSAPKSAYGSVSGYSDLALSSTTGEVAMVWEQGTATDQLEDIAFYNFNQAWLVSGTATKQATGTDLTGNSINVWTGGAGPNGSPAATDIAYWSPSSFGAALTLTNDTTWGAMDVEGATTAIAISGTGTLTLNGSANQLVQGMADVGINIPATGVNLTINNNLNVDASQTWNIGNSRILGVDTGVSGLTTTIGTGATLILSGGGTVQVGGSGVTTLTGSGNLAINGVTFLSQLQSGSSSSGYTGNTTLNSGTIAIATGNSPFGLGALALNGGSIGSANANAVTISNAVTIGGTVSFGGATGLGPGEIVFSGNADLGGTIQTLNAASGVTAAFSGTVGEGGIIATGAGTLVLSGTNTYTGATTLSNGLLELDGSLSSETLLVNGGTLDGNGAIGGPVILNSGTLAAGTTSGCGTLSINSLTLSGGTVVLRVNKTGGFLASDSFSVLSNVTFGGTLTVTNITSDTNLLAAGDMFQLFSGGNYSGNFTTYHLPALAPGLNWDLSTLTTDGIIRLTDKNSVTTPAFNPPTGSYLGPQSVIISSDVGATIFYTTNGASPTYASSSGISPVIVNIPSPTVMTVKAYATNSIYINSPVASATYYTLASAIWTNWDGGSWAAPGNWLNSAVATGTNTVADFSRLALSANAIITLDGARTIAGLLFDDQSASKHDWTLISGSAGPLMLAGSGGIPSISNNVPTTIGAMVIGSGGLIKTGAGSLVLTNANTFSGGAEINAGALQLGNGSGGVATAGTGAIQIDSNAALVFNFGSAVDAYANNITGTGTIVENGEGALATGGEVGLTGSNTFSGLIQINTNKVALSSATSGLGAPRIAIGSNGLFSIGSGYAGGTLTISELSGEGLINPQFGSTAGVRTLLINQSTATTFSGAMSDTTSSRTMALIKSGLGTLVLSGTNTFTNSTTISNGVLEVDGSLASGVVMINGGTLNGSGTLAGAVTVTNGGVFSAGVNGAGTLTVNGTLTLGSNSSTLAHVNAASGVSAFAHVIGGIAYGGGLVVTIQSGTVSNGQNFQIFSGKGMGSFNSISPIPAPGFAWSFDSGTGYLTAISVVNTNATTMTAVLVGGNLDLSWPMDHIGWQLQIQTNSHGIGISTNWVGWTSSTATNQVAVPIGLTNQAVFLRLVYPPR